MKSILTYIFLALLIIFVIIQFFGIDKSLPQYEASGDFLATHTPPSEVETMFRTACYDCHSYETRYPWYSNIQPVAWWLQGHIEEGREEMNFSLWDNYSMADADHYLEEIIEVVDEEEMPLPSYTWAHSEARLTDAQREELTAWVRSLRGRLQGDSNR